MAEVNKIKDFLLPPPVDNPIWSLTEKEKLFLDMTIVHKVVAWRLYRMSVADPNITDIQCKKRVQELLTSIDAEDYINTRRLQLSKHFFPEDFRDKRKPIKIGADGFSEGFEQKVIRELETILDNPSSPVFFDALKVAFQKVSSSMDSKSAPEPPKRYLPVVPCGECRYKLFIEKEVIDECKVCRYRQFANDNGIFYDHKNQLDRSLSNESGVAQKSKTE